MSETQQSGSDDNIKPPVLRVLHLEDNAQDRELVGACLAAEGLKFEVTYVKSKQEFESALSTSQFDVILSDYTLPSYDGLSALRFAKAHHPIPPFIFVSGTIGEERAVESMKSGATDYVLKENLSRLGSVVRRALREAKDRAERIRAEQALYESNARLAASEAELRALFSAMTDVVLVLDSEGRYLQIAPTNPKLLVKPAAELLGKTVHEVLSAQDADRVVMLVRQALTKREPQKLEYSLPIDGVEFWFESTVSPMEGNKVFWIARDITDRVQTEAKVREQAALLNEARDAIIVRDLEHRLIFWNKSAERIYGWSADEVLGRRVDEFLYADIIEFRKALPEVERVGEWNGEVHQLTKSGKQLLVETRWTLVRDEAGRPKSVFAINTDITERRALESQLLRNQRMESIGTLASGIAHDLNNVLAPILMAIELLRMDEKNKSRLELLKTIQSSAERGAEMVKQVLAFGRGVEGKRMLVQCAHLFSEIQKIVSQTFPKNIRFRMAAPKTLWMVSGDPTQLHQVLLNLCVNARDAMPDGGNLSVSAENILMDDHFVALNPEAKPGPYICIQVVDTGTGMPREVMEKIFDPFFTTKEVGKGTGLGLSTSLAIVKSHGGFMRVESEPGKGTRFIMYLPAQIDSRAEIQPSTADLPLGNGELILVVDDEAAVRQITRQTLEGFGYQALVASDGAEALAQYATHKDQIAVVMLDMMMPILDGVATAHALMKINPKVRIIAATGLNAKNQEGRARETGVRHFLAKPYTAETLLNTLREVLKVNSD